MSIIPGSPEHSLLDNMISTEIIFAGSYGNYSDFLFGKTHHTQANLAISKK